MGERQLQFEPTPELGLYEILLGREPSMPEKERGVIYLELSGSEFDQKVDFIKENYPESIFQPGAEILGLIVVGLRSEDKLVIYLFKETNP